jgi:predicted DNA-binding WGR domain protein
VASIQKQVVRNGAITYRVRVRIKGQYRTKTVPRKTDVRDWATSIESDIKRRRYVPTTAASRHTVADLVDRDLAEVLFLKARN